MCDHRIWEWNPIIQGTCEVCEKSPINFIKNWAMWILLMFSDDVHPLDALQRCYHQVIILHPRRFTIFGSALPILIFEAPFLGIVEKELMGLWDGLFYFFTFFLGFWFTFFCSFKFVGWTFVLLLFEEPSTSWI